MIKFQQIITPEEIAEFVPIADEIWHEFWDSRISKAQVNYMLSNFQSYDAVKKQIEEGYEYYFIIKDNEIAGYTGICPKENHIFLSKLYLKNTFRKCGLGRKTLEFIISRAKAYNLCAISLTVNKYNETTIAAYKKWGFKTINSVVTDIGDGFVMDDYIMAKNV